MYLYKLLRNEHGLDRIGYMDLIMSDKVGEPLEIRVVDTAREDGCLLDAVNRPPIMIYSQCYMMQLLYTTGS